MNTAARHLTPMTVDEFLAWDGGGHQGKLELVDGAVRAMAPASPTHGRIQANLVYLLQRHLYERRRGCSVIVEPGVLPRVRSRDNTRVPDIGVTCSPDTRGAQLLRDPILLVEILSPGNTSKTWGNVWTYVTIPTVAEILIVHSTRIMAELLRRGADGAWPEEPQAIDAGGAIELAAIGCVISLNDVYEGTYLTSPINAGGEGAR